MWPIVYDVHCMYQNWLGTDKGQGNFANSRKTNFDAFRCDKDLSISTAKTRRSYGWSFQKIIWLWIWHILNENKINTSTRRIVDISIAGKVMNRRIRITCVGILTQSSALKQAINLMVHKISMSSYKFAKNWSSKLYSLNITDVITFIETLQQAVIN